MHFPNIYEICSKDLLTISENESLENAINKMISASHRNIIVLGGHYPHILLAQDILQFNLEKVDTQRPLSQFHLARLPLTKGNENILESVRFLKEEIEYIGVTDETDQLIGLLTHTDIVNSIDPEILMDYYSISDVLQKHRHDLWVRETEDTEQVIAKMVTHKTDCVLALDTQGKLTGIFTTKDVLALYGQKKLTHLPLSKNMTFPVETVISHTTVKEAIAFIKDKPFKRVVVATPEGYPEGVIMQRDLIALTYNKWAMIMRQFHDELKELNELLEQKTERYQKLASEDPLTGLYNRYKFTEIFTTEFLNMRSHQSKMSLIMFDIDFFKSINDTHGHNKGDEVLIQIAETIRQKQRKTDLICRWGGEEFIILLPSANLEQANLIAEQLRIHISGLPLLANDPVTASFGVTEVQNNDSLEQVVGRADGALYQAKQQGRNQVVSR